MYVKITSGSVDTYPYNVGQLRRDNPNTSFSSRIPLNILEEYGVFPVSVSDMPVVDDRTQLAVQDSTPSLIDGAWTVDWNILSKSSEDIQTWDENLALSNRRKRDGLLAETDYFALADVTMDAPMITYRQALRDLPTHSNWPNLEDADWPNKPN